MRTLRLVLPLAVLGAALIVGVRAVAAVSDTYVDPTHGTVKFHPFTLDPNNDSCVLWSGEPSGLTHNCDPVNLIFAGRNWRQARDALVARGWTTAGSGSTQWLHLANERRLIQQHVQLFREDPSKPGNRWHIRLWEASRQMTLGAVHYERWDDVTQTHVIDAGWDTAEGFVAGQFCGASCQGASLTTQSSIQGGDVEWRGWTNDAKATVIP
jgi:hypothetical protein